MIRSLRNLILRDLWLKLFALALAVLIWTTVSFAVDKGNSPNSAISNHDPQQTFYNLPITVRLPATDVRKVEVNPTVVEVTVQAKKPVLEQLKSESIRAEVDLTGIESGRLHPRIEVIVPLASDTPAWSRTRSKWSFHPEIDPDQP